MRVIGLLIDCYFSTPLTSPQVINSLHWSPGMTSYSRVSRGLPVLLSSLVFRASSRLVWMGAKRAPHARC